jgi:hypothetical protein
MAKQRSTEEPQSLASRGHGRWLVASYQPVTLFSLRMTHATSKGGKTLVVPTPYAVKMALLDACFRRFAPNEASEWARRVFDWLKRREIRVRPPKYCVVNNTFVKILDWSRERTDGPFRNTIVYREFAFFEGDDMLVAVAAAGLGDEELRIVEGLFAHINSLGKRGGFWQFTGTEILEGELPHGFTVPRNEASLDQIASYAMTLALDDFGDTLCSAGDGFDRVSTYGSGTIRLGEHRVLTTTAVPYFRRSASRHFTWYERAKRPGGG